MAAEQRLRNICVCVCAWEIECMDIVKHIYFEAFSFPHCELALLHTYASCFPTCTAFPRLSSAAGPVCVFVFSNTCSNSCFLFNTWICFSLVFILYMEHQDALPSYSLFWLPFFCANTHNSSGLICYSFPLASASPSSQPMGLMAQDLSLLTLLVVRLQRYFFFFYPLSLSLLPFLCCTDFSLLHVHSERSLKAPLTRAEACWDL